METHFVDGDSERLRFGRDLAFDEVKDMASLFRQQGAQGDLAELPPRGGTDELSELRVRCFRRSDSLIEAQRIDNAIARIGLHLEPLLVAHDRLLDRRLEQQRARRRHVNRVDERSLHLQARLIDDADRRAEPNDERLLALADDVDGRDDQVEGERNNGDRRQPTASHLAAPCVGAGAGAAGAGGLNSVTGI